MRRTFPDRLWRHDQADDLDTLNIKQLKALARDNGVSLDGCAEKRDIVDRSVAEPDDHDYRRRPRHSALGSLPFMLATSEDAPPSTRNASDN